MARVEGSFGRLSFRMLAIVIALLVAPGAGSALRVKDEKDADRASTTPAVATKAISGAVSKKRRCSLENGPLGLDSTTDLFLRVMIDSYITGPDGNLTVQSFFRVLNVVAARAKDDEYHLDSNLHLLKTCESEQSFFSELESLTVCLKNQCSTLEDLVKAEPEILSEEIVVCSLYLAVEGRCRSKNDKTRAEEMYSEHKKIPWQHSLGYGSAFTFVIVLGSQFGGLLFPFRHSLVYKICLTYLIGLAVGTLSGGGILHLMPHTFGMDESEEGVEFIFRASTILGGIYLFYIVERLLRDLNQWRKERRRIQSEQSRMQQRWELKQANLKVGNRASTNAELGHEGTSVATPLSVGFENNVTVIPTKEATPYNGTVAKTVDVVQSSDGNGALIGASTPVSPICNAGFPGDGSHDFLILKRNLEREESLGADYKSHTTAENQEKQRQRRRCPSETHVQNAMMEEESHRVRLPSHTHAEVNDTQHEVGEIAPIAWIVIMAKAFSSFIDGLSMGAAFTESTLTGVKIAIAIICEEFPHELGDIAILLNSGMNFKQALFSNFCAASPTFFGLCIGIAVGENTDANPWIFAIAAGMFLYIALVDMIPELNALGQDLVRSGINQIVVCLIQHLGMLSGFVLMLIMAIYGNDINV